MTKTSITKLFFLILFIILPGTLLVPSATAAFKYLNEGMNLPAIEGIDTKTGEQVSIDVIFNEKKMVIVVFWASWSERSIEELEALKELYPTISEKPIQFIAVNVEGQNISGSKKQSLVDFINNMNIPFLSIIDDNLKIFNEFGVIAVPSTAISDTSGVLRYAPSGFSLTTHDLIVDSIEILLGIKKSTTVAIVKKGYIPKKKSLRYYNLALNLTNKRSYERALSNLELAISADSNFAVPFSLRGEVLLKLNNITDAVSSYAKAVQLDSLFVAAWTGYGEALMLNNQLDDAILKFETALKLDSQYTPAFLNLGLCLSQQDKVSEALDSLNKALELNMKNPQIHYYLGQMHLKMNDTTKATESYRTALEILFE